MLRVTSRCLAGGLRKIRPVSLAQATASVKLPFSSEADFPNAPTVYETVKDTRDRMLQSKLNNPNRFQTLAQREDRSDWSAEMRKIQAPAKLQTVYRGLDILKTCEDFGTYHQLFWYVRPPTVIELGTYSGGMTVWLADTMKLIDNPCHIYSFDLDHSLVDDTVKKLLPENVTFLEGDCYAIEKTFTPDFMQQLPHPWVVIDDAHENLPGVLKHFHQFMKEGDYLVVEDSDPNIPKEYPSDLDQMQNYEPTGYNKLEQVKAFLREYKEHYAVDSFFTDLFGYNGTWHWHGFIKRMK